MRLTSRDGELRRSFAAIVSRPPSGESGSPACGAFSPIFPVEAPRISRRFVARSAGSRHAEIGIGVAIVLDSWALLALLNDEPVADRVEQAWVREKPLMCSINLGEVLYALIRTHGEDPARRAIKKARAELSVLDPDWSLVVEAARIKAGGGLSYADCFALATARQTDAQLWTGDPELIDLASRDEIIDLRS